MKCKISKGEIKPCPGLNSVLEMGSVGTRQKGVQLQTLINFKTGKFSRHLAVIKSGDHRKNGLVMNYCPFCRAVLYVEPRKSNVARR